MINSIENINSYLKTNVSGTGNILDMMKKIGCNRIIFGSSSSIYGNSENASFTETDLTDAPLTPYATSKKAGELLTYNYHHIFDFRVINLRFFTVYGPAQRPDLAIHKFAKLILQNKPVVIYGNGQSARDYTYVSDIVDGIVSSIELISNSERIYEIINLGNNKPITISELVNQLYLLMNKKPVITFEPDRRGDMITTCANISKAEKLLNYHPKTSIQKGMRNFID